MYITQCQRKNVRGFVSNEFDFRIQSVFWSLIDCKHSS